MDDLIRSSALTGYSDLVLTLGGDPVALLRRFQWTQQTIEKQDAAISYRSLIQLMELTAAKLKCRDFGLRLAQQQSIHILGPLAIIALHSDTVGNALRAIIQQLDYYSPACIARLDMTNPRKPVLTFDAAIAGEPHRRQTLELAIGVSCRDLMILTDGDFTPKEVLFRHSALATKATYLKHFRVTPKFEQQVNGIVMAADILQRKLKTDDPYLRKVVIDYVQQSTRNKPLDMAPQVAFLIKQLLSTRPCTLRSVAEHLCLHHRTLQRRLEMEGTTFEVILDGVRRDMARTLLTESRIPLAQTATSLGYSEQSAFSRACKRWFGVTPFSVRSQRRHRI